MATETVALLFTDWVGSTEILTSLGEVATDSLRRDMYELTRAGAAQHGGREVKNLGDGLMLAFPSASACVAGGVAVLQNLARRNARSEIAIHLRSGASVGDADTVDGDFFGIAVVEAARLCARADAEQLLVSESILLLARDRSGFGFDPVGELALKGFDQPVRAYSVTWEPLATEASSDIPLPARIARDQGVEFVGRALERESLSQSLKEVVAEPRRRVTLLAGEAGIGKTSLVSRFACSAHASGATVLYGRCDEELRLPLQPWSEALEHLVRHVDGSVLDDHVAARGGDLMPLVPTLAERLGTPIASRSDDPETGRHLMFGAVVDLLTRASADRPIVLVVDDLHWADRNSIHLLRHVAASSEPMRLLVIGTYRDADVSSTHPLADLLAALHRESDVTRLTLRGFDQAELVEFLASVAGHDLDDDGLRLGDALARETGGNPFFVTEMLRHLVESHAIVHGDDGRWSAAQSLTEAGLPVSVREVIGRRITRLDDTTRRILSAASVMGREFDLAVLAAVTGLDEDAVIDGLDAARDAGLVSEVPAQVDRYTFVHVLFQRALYDELGGARRRRLHIRVAEELEAADREDAVADLARHWYAATRPENADRALTYALKAGDQAFEGLAPDDAVRWYERAVELVDLAGRADLRVDCLTRLGTAQRLAAIPAHRDTLLRACRIAATEDDAHGLTNAALQNYRGFFSIGGNVDQDRIDMLDLALERLPRSELALRARLLAHLAVETFFAPDRTPVATIDEALRIADECGSLNAQLDALNALLICYSPASLERRLALIDDALDLAAESGDPGRAFWTLQGVHLAQIQSRDLAGATSSLESMRSLAAELGDPTTSWVVAIMDQLHASVSLDFTRTDQLAQRTLDRGTATGQPDAFLIGGSQIWVALFERGEWDEVVALLLPVLPMFDVPVVHTCAAGGLMQEGRTNEARAVLEPYRDYDLTRALANDPLCGATMCGLALCASLLDSVELSELESALRVAGDQWVTTGASIFPPTALALALVLDAQGRFAEADLEFDRAHRLSQPLPLLEVYCGFIAAITVANRTSGGNADLAVEQLRETIAVVEPLGLTRMTSDCRTALTRIAGS